MSITINDMMFYEQDKPADKPQQNTVVKNMSGDNWNNLIKFMKIKLTNDSQLQILSHITEVYIWCFIVFRGVWFCFLMCNCQMIFVITFIRISRAIAFMWMAQEPTDYKSTLIQVNNCRNFDPDLWCHMASQDQLIYLQHMNIMVDENAWFPSNTGVGRNIVSNFPQALKTAIQLLLL